VVRLLLDLMDDGLLLAIQDGGQFARSPQVHDQIDENLLRGNTLEIFP
jgi:hypothetical protein